MKVYVNDEFVEFEVAVQLMDDDIREEIHAGLDNEDGGDHLRAAQGFADEYCDRHYAKYGVEFRVI